MLRPALVSLLALAALTGLAYPLATTAAAVLLFPKQAHGSLIKDGSRVTGSGLLGQASSDPRQFWGRPSASGADPDASGGTNWAPSNPALAEAVRSRVEALRRVDPGNAEPVPVDLVTASGSGLDPDISPAAAAYQAGRVARLRGLPESRVQALVAAHTEGRTFGVLGEPRVNVLLLNRALDKLAP
jgi:K+-transporting ATPase ATPase C chain